MQSELVETGSNRVVAVLTPVGRLPRTQRLLPIVYVDGQDFILLVSRLTNLPARELRRPQGNIAQHRDKIIAALDVLFTGI